MTHMHYTLGLFPICRNSYQKFCWPWWREYLTPSNYWCTLKYFCQRGYRGYAECDHWDADSYFETVMHGVIRDLRDHNNGFPAHLSDYPMGENPKDGEAQDTGAEKWQAILNEIVEGFEASLEHRLEDTVPLGTYSDEPIEWEDVEGSEGKLMQIKDTGRAPFNRDLFQEWEKPLLAKRKRGLELLVEHWGSFWD